MLVLDGDSYTEVVFAVFIRYRYILYVVDILHVDQGSENRVYLLVLDVCTCLLLHGKLWK